MRGLADRLVARVVEEAGAAVADATSRAPALVSAVDGGDEGKGAKTGGPAAGAALHPSASRRGTAGSSAPLTSLDIQRAVKRVLPGAGAPDQPLRPYLPASAKRARQLDRAAGREAGWGGGGGRGGAGGEGDEVEDS